MSVTITLGAGRMREVIAPDLSNLPPGADCHRCRDRAGNAGDTAAAAGILGGYEVAPAAREGKEKVLPGQREEQFQPPQRVSRGGDVKVSRVASEQKSELRFVPKNGGQAEGQAGRRVKSWHTTI